MLNGDIVRAWLDEAVEAASFAEAPSLPEGVESLDAAECDDMLARLLPYARAVRFLQDGAKARLAEHLGTRGFVRFGERTYRAAPDDKETLKADKRGDFYRLIEDEALVAEVFPHYSARKGGLRELASRFVDPETGELGSWEAFREFFYDVTEGEVKVTELPTSRAPKFIQQSEDGSVERRG